jgi:hypothetical protein
MKSRIVIRLLGGGLVAIAMSVSSPLATQAAPVTGAGDQSCARATGPDRRPVVHTCVTLCSDPDPDESGTTVDASIQTSETLDYACVCSNGMSPGPSEPPNVRLLQPGEPVHITGELPVTLPVRTGVSAQTP